MRGKSATHSYNLCLLGFGNVNRTLVRLLLDRKNNLYGTTGWGGKSRCLMDQGIPYTCGLVFKLTKGTSVPWKEKG